MSVLTQEATTGAVGSADGAGGYGLVRYLVVRFLLIIPTVLVLVSVVFFLMRVSGDPITTAFGDRLTPAQLHAKLHQAGYDRPLLTQYLDYLRALATGNFGRTATDNQAVSRCCGPTARRPSSWPATRCWWPWPSASRWAWSPRPTGTARRTPRCGCSPSSTTPRRCSSSGCC
ncbi:hypothetical protein [Streptacidiphilus sp. PAMC 29251]